MVSSLDRRFATASALWFNHQKMFNDCVKCFRQQKMVSSLYRGFATASAVWFDHQKMVHVLFYNGFINKQWVHD